jgi:hypothetical protein
MNSGFDLPSNEQSALKDQGQFALYKLYGAEPAVQIFH